MRFGVLHKYLSNTNVFEHSKKLYSIAENHMPQEINIQTLETLGNWTVNGAWSQSFTAHPKVMAHYKNLFCYVARILLKCYRTYITS